jgi:hypothetical protein
MRRRVTTLVVLAGLAAPAAARAEFNVNPQIPVDLGLMVDFGDGVDHLAGLEARYRLDFYIYGFAVTAGYDRVELDHPADVAHGGSLGGQIFFSPMGFVLLLIEDKMLAQNHHTLHRLLDWVNLSVPAGLRVGLGHDGTDLRARLAAWVGGELVLRYARPDWKFWPELTFSVRRQIGVPEDRAETDLVFGIGIARRVAL